MLKYEQATNVQRLDMALPYPQEEDNEFEDDDEGLRAYHGQPFLEPLGCIFVE